MIIKGKLYDFLKPVALVGLPAFATLYFALAQIWGLSNGPEVVATVTTIDTFLGSMLHLSSGKYHKSDKKYDGTMHVTDEKGVKLHNLEVHGDLDKLSEKKSVIFKVKNSAEGDSEEVNGF